MSSLLIRMDELSSVNDSEISPSKPTFIRLLTTGKDFEWKSGQPQQDI